MSGFLLDTNIPSETVRLQPDLKVGSWLAAQKLGSLHISVVTCGELRKGIARLDAGKRKEKLEHWYREDFLKRFSGRILPFTQVIAERWGALEALRAEMGSPIQVPDAQIAATALEHGLTLVTRNVRHFEGLGVALINPWD